jgi:hypothetical protein
MMRRRILLPAHPKPGQPGLWNLLHIPDRQLPTAPLASPSLLSNFTPGLLLMKPSSLGENKGGEDNRIPAAIEPFHGTSLT